MIKYKIIFNGKVLILTEKEYENFIKAKADKKFIQECLEVSKL